MLTLSSIAKSFLLDRGYPMHWYLSALKQACEGAKELAMHTISIVKTEVLTVDSYGYAKYPCDYSFYIRLGAGYEGRVVPLVYGQGSGRGLYNRLPSGWYGIWNSFYGPTFNEFGENTAALTGYVGHNYNTFEEIPERKAFRLNAPSGTQIVLDYSPVLGKCNNATLVPDAAEFAIKDWIHWKMPRYERKGGAGDEQMVYLNSLRKLRAFNNTLTPERLQQLREESMFRGSK